MRWARFSLGLLSLLLIVTLVGCTGRAPAEEYASPTDATIADMTPPSAPSNLSRVTPDTDFTPTFTWSPAADVGTGVAYYLVNIDRGSFVNIGNTTSYAVTSPLRLGNHAIWVKAVDGANNEGLPAVLSFVCVVGDSSPPDDTSPPTDTDAPSISSVSVTNISTSSATVTWSTSEPTTGQVEYGPTTGYGRRSLPDNNLSTRHSVLLTGLNADTTYHYRVRSVDASNNEATSTDRTFRTLAQPDDTGPVISTVWATTITRSGAEIRWTTNEGSTSQVEYGLTSFYGSFSIMQTAYVIVHSVALTGLASGTTYHYRVRSKDSAGNESTSAEFSFTTEAGDTAAPVISGVQALSIMMDCATITWTTNEGSTSQVSYGTTAACVIDTSSNTSLVTIHYVELSGLTQGTMYYFRVRSKDYGGNEGISEVFTFRTFSCSDLGNWVDVYYCQYGELPAVPTWMRPYVDSDTVHQGVTVQLISYGTWNYDLTASQREQILQLLDWLGESREEYLAKMNRMRPPG